VPRGKRWLENRINWLTHVRISTNGKTTRVKTREKERVFFNAGRVYLHFSINWTYPVTLSRVFEELLERPAHGNGGEFQRVSATDTRQYENRYFSQSLGDAWRVSSDVSTRIPFSAYHCVTRVKTRFHRRISWTRGEFWVVALDSVFSDSQSEAATWPVRWVGWDWREIDKYTQKIAPRQILYRNEDKNAKYLPNCYPKKSEPNQTWILVPQAYFQIFYKPNFSIKIPLLLSHSFIH